VPQVRSAESLLSGLLRAVELQIELELAIAKRFSKLIRESVVRRNPNSISIEEDVVDSRVVVTPGEQLEELGVESRFSARKLEDFYPPLSIDHSLDPLLQFGERHGVDGTRALRVRVAGGAGEIAGANNLDQREAGA